MPQAGRQTTDYFLVIRRVAIGLWGGNATGAPYPRACNRQSTFEQKRFVIGDGQNQRDLWCVALVIAFGPYRCRLARAGNILAQNCA